MAGKLVFLDWIYDVSATNVFRDNGDKELEREIREEVRRAIAALPEVDREFIQLYWFEGQSIAEIAKRFNKHPHNIEGYSQRILRKLRRLLADFVASRFGVETVREPCLICCHPHRLEIEEILRGKRPEETFKRIYRELAKRFGLRITTPQILIGHMKYHMLKEECDE